MINFRFQKEQFLAEREKLFSDSQLYENSYEFCIKYSLLVEEYIVNLLQPANLNCVMAAVGSFARRELSPYSDIDLMFIFPSRNNSEPEIEHCVSKLLDVGINVSYTLREFDDIDKYLKEDLHAFTQFFETRFLLGNKEFYDMWNAKLFQSIEKTNKEKLIFAYFEDIEDRYKKYGESPKVLEPNVKFTGGALRDIHSVEWMYSVRHQKLLSGQDEITQTEIFLKELLTEAQINRKAYKRLYESYKVVLRARNMLHIVEGRKNDRLEFGAQEKIAKLLGYAKENWKDFMHEYFHAATILNRFSKTMMKRYKQEFSTKLSNYLSINLDDDFEILGEILLFKNDRVLTISDIMRAFYYRCMNNARFDKNLRTLIIESIHLIEETNPMEATSSVFFREMLKLPANIGKTLISMNEFGFLDILLPEFKSLNGFFEPGVYHFYTADEHSLVGIRKLEELSLMDNSLAIVYKSLPSKDLLYLAILLHDIGKPISVSGHEIIGAEIANSIMQSLGYGQSDIVFVQFLVKYHLLFEQTAFRKDLNNTETIENFSTIFPSIVSLDHLYLLSYANLSAVNPQVLTQWKSDLLSELYTKVKAMILEQLTDAQVTSRKFSNFTNRYNYNEDDLIAEHLEQVDDIRYAQQFSQQEISEHIDEINKGNKFSIIFKAKDSFTNITVITKDSTNLFSRLCGLFSINELNVHDANVFTRNDGMVIYNFNVTEFGTNHLVSEKKYKNIEKGVAKAIAGELKIEKEFEKVKSKIKKNFKEAKNTELEIEIEFEENEKYNVIEISSPDRLGLFYTITNKMAELGLYIAFAKITTLEESVVGVFYIQKNNEEKLRKSEYGFISSELKEAIEKIL
jgi:[protein-PII] uridylyltransferase